MAEKKGYFGFQVLIKVNMCCSKCGCNLKEWLPKTANTKAKARAFMIKKNWTFLKNGWIVCDICNYMMNQKKKPAVKNPRKRQNT